MGSQPARRARDGLALGQFADASARGRPAWSALTQGLFGEALLLVLLSCLNYWPVFLGLIPLPAQIALGFPPYADIFPGSGTSIRHAEMGDLITQFYPWAGFAAESVRRGEVPLWNPHLLNGSPFIANAQSAVFSPLSLPYYVLPLSAAWAAGFIAKPVLAGLLTILFVQTLGASKLGSMVAGISFAFCGFMIGWQGFPLTSAALWLPLMLLAVDRLRRKPTAGSLALASCSFSLPILAGQPQTAAHLVLVASGYAAYRLACPPLGSQLATATRWSYLGCLGLTGALGFALSAIQLLPTLEWLTEIARSLQHSWGARRPDEILAFLSRDVSSSRKPAGIEIPEGSAYVGIFTLLAASFAPFHRRRRDVIFFAVALAVCLQVIYGVGPLYRLSQELPVVQGLRNWRLLVVASFSLAVLAALGITALQQHVCSTRPLIRPGLALLVPLSTLGLCGFGIWILQLRTGPTDTASVAWRNSPLSSLALLLLSATVITLALTRRLPRWMASGTILTVVIVDLLSFSAGYHPFSRPDEVYPRAPVFDFLRQNLSADHRSVSVNDTLVANSEMAYGLHTPAGYDVSLRTTNSLLRPFVPERYGYVMNPFEAQRILEAPRGLLDLLAVKYIVATTQNKSARLLDSAPERFRRVYRDRTVRVYENLTALPIARVLPLATAEVIAEDTAALRRVTAREFDASGSVVLDRQPAVPAGSQSGQPPRTATAGLARDGPNTISISADSPSDAILLISESHYPGWQATLDGEPVPIVRANYAFMGVPVPAGRHQVELRYAPASFRIGAAVSLTACGLLALLSLLSALRRTRS